MLPIINNRSDIESLSQEERDQFMNLLAGSVWKLQRDDENQRWILIEDLSTITRYGVSLVELSDIPKPDIPEWKPLPDPRESIQCTAFQGLLALDQSGLATVYQTWADDSSRTFAEKAFITRAQTWRRMDPILLSAAVSLGLTEQQLDDLFELAVTL